mgnify:CR=1 FL=1
MKNGDTDMEASIPFLTLVRYNGTMDGTGGDGWAQPVLTDLG